MFLINRKYQEREKYICVVRAIKGVSTIRLTNLLVWFKNTRQLLKVIDFRHCVGL